MICYCTFLESTFCYSGSCQIFKSIVVIQLCCTNYITFISIGCNAIEWVDYPGKNHLIERAGILFDLRVSNAGLSMCCQWLKAWLWLYWLWLTMYCFIIHKCHSGTALQPWFLQAPRSFTGWTCHMAPIVDPLSPICIYI